MLRGRAGGRQSRELDQDHRSDSPVVVSPSPWPAGAHPTSSMNSRTTAPSSACFLGEHASSDVVWFSLPGGRTLYSAGDPADTLYLLRAGRLGVIRRGEEQQQQFLGIIKPGEPAGEMALISGTPHTATVLAMRDSEVLALPRKTFFEAARKDPALMAEMARADHHPRATGCPPRRLRRADGVRHDRRFRRPADPPHGGGDRTLYHGAGLHRGGAGRRDPVGADGMVLHRRAAARRRAVRGGAGRGRLDPSRRTAGGSRDADRARRSGAAVPALRLRRPRRARAPADGPGTGPARDPQIAGRVGRLARRLPRHPPVPCAGTRSFRSAPHGESADRHLRRRGVLRGRGPRLRSHRGDQGPFARRASRSTSSAAPPWERSSARARP